MLVCNGRVVDPTQHLDGILDLRIRDGLIAELGEHLAPDGEEEILDARGAYVAPGFIDMHVHLRDPGQPEKESVATGTAAALAGGYAAVACMPNTLPALDEAALVRRVAADPRARCRVYPIAAITRARKGTEILDYDALARGGAVAFSDDGNTVMDAGVLSTAATAALGTRGCFISHCEDDRLKGNGVMNDGALSHELGFAGSCAASEDIVVARDLLIAAATGKRWHMAHLSTRGSIELMRWARSRGNHATCEVTPHHLLLQEDAIREFGSGAKVNPPLRAEDDSRALRDGVRDGTVDAFASDHAPHERSAKTAALPDAAAGFSGLEIAVGAYAAALPDLPVARFVELLSCNPARILGVAGGTLAVGAPGDVTIFADRPWVVDPDRFHSKGKNTPFAGQRLPRRAVATIVGGRVRMAGGLLR